MRKFAFLTASALVLGLGVSEALAIPSEADVSARTAAANATTVTSYSGFTALAPDAGSAAPVPFASNGHHR